MFLQHYDPLGSLWLSALVAALPILVFLLGLTLFKLKGITAAIIALALTAVLGTAVFGLPVPSAASAAVYGVLNGLWPIGWIVLMAVWLYRIAVRAGKFETIRASIAAISTDQRVQVLLIAYCFGGFLEGAAGFGIPIAICAALLVALGFEPLRAAMLALVANAAAGSYGAIGIPVIVGAQQGGVGLHELSAMMVLVTILVTAAVPFLLMAIMDGWRGLRETFPVALVSGLVFGGLQAAVLLLLGPELADIVPPLGAMVALTVTMRRWQPKRIYREPGAPEPAAAAGGDRPAGRQVLAAWSPFYILSVLILLWSLPGVKALTAPGGPLSFTSLSLQMPALHQAVARTTPIVEQDAPLTAVWNLNLLSASGTAILVAAIITVLSTRAIGWREAGQELAGAWRQLSTPILMICLVMAVANIMSFAGMSSTLGLALAAAGSVFPLLSPIIGWIGVFVTGSVVNSNTLFAGLQAVTAGQIGVNQTLLVASSTAGGLMAKVVSPQSIAIATAAVDRSGQESRLMRLALPYSLGLLAYACLWVLALSLVL
ncbi:MULTISPECIES: L-lactate permease [Rothia]|uniref:L-lactate permease n=1 Tax=Rothia kristinae TaxID=37923 RepID=A0A199NR63_9MICC|nr:lactate permease LctP family transporter [Rothia kristinae]TDP57261.1 lactate permease [Kocuria sp. AG109]MCT1357829.1 lactate permease LctP family transporter [Rothia kristinae]MCT1393655.1 lactate permease LctP family transporter [Rothia kristinae]MCT1505989.1 lactate permease LctP family transporter [Rothia kristinae]MCT2039123.1 lactate permease LctP family transporter [Rothia kristinae]